MHGEEAAGLRLIGHSDLGGFGDAMQVMRHDDALYVAHLGTSGKGTSILDVSDVTSPRLIRQWNPPAGTHTHKVQVADGMLAINHERFRSDSWESAGLALYDLTEPFDPHQIGFWPSGGEGVHRIVWEGGEYAYLSATPEGFDDRIWFIVDLTDPEHPEEVGRWWWPGMWTGGGEQPDWPADETRNVHHGMVHGDRAYVGLWDSGMVILDISEPTNPTVVSRLTWEVGGRTHTCLPLPGREL
ncbi:MAG: LVIVD repeat-containing protein, partial [Acidimicrobiia bacterium]